MSSPVNDDGERSFPVPHQTGYLTTYRHEGIWLAIGVGLGAVLIIAGLIGLQYTVRLISSLTVFQSFQFGISFLVLAVMGAFAMAYTLMARLVLHNDYIEDQGIFWTRRFTRSQVAGKKRFATTYRKAVVIYPVDTGRLPMKIEMVFKSTPAFEAWMASIPDIDVSQANWRGKSWR